MPKNNLNYFYWKDKKAKKTDSKQEKADNIDIIDKMRQVKKSKKYIDIFFGSKILIIWWAHI